MKFGVVIEMKKLISYYMVFFKVGLLTIGGGYAMLPVLQKEAVENKSWFSETDVLDSYALAQSIPGIIAVNASALLGYKLNGVKGAIATCLGVITPSLIIIIIIASIYHQAAELPIVHRAFSGIRIAVLAILTMTIIRMIKTSIKDIGGILLALITLICILVFKISPIYIILVGILVSVLIYYRRGEHNDSDTN